MAAVPWVLVAVAAEVVQEVVEVALVAVVVVDSVAAADGPLVVVDSVAADVPWVRADSADGHLVWGLAASLPERHFVRVKVAAVSLPLAAAAADRLVPPHRVPPPFPRLRALLHRGSDRPAHLLLHRRRVGPKQTIPSITATTLPPTIITTVVAIMDRTGGIMDSQTTITRGD